MSARYFTALTGVGAAAIFTSSELTLYDSSQRATADKSSKPALVCAIGPRVAHLSGAALGEALPRRRWRQQPPLLAEHALPLGRVFAWR